MNEYLWAALFALAFYHLWWRARLKFQRKARVQEWRENDLSDTDNQLKFVSEAMFERKAIMSREEYGVFTIVEQFAAEKKIGYRVFPEVCLGAVLWCNEHYGDTKAFRSINSKRLDIGVVDKFGKLRLAVEYQGGGHWQGNARGRDAVKRLALEKAGVKLIEIFPNESPDIIKSKIRSVLG